MQAARSSAHPVSRVPDASDIPAGVAYIHVGTHKTGTTAVQYRLSASDAILASAGVLVPQAGRTERTSGHHNIAWELGRDERFSPAAGTIAMLLDEVAQRSARVVAISSEEFEHLHRRPEALAPLVDGLRAHGYRVEIVLYLRSQSAYAESLYAELLKHGYGRAFDTFVDDVVGAGRITAGNWSFEFDYERLVGAFAQIAGSDAVIVRSYGEGRHAVSPADDFLRLLGVDPACPRLARARRLNRRASFGDIIRRIGAGRGLDPSAPPPLAAIAAGSRFDPIGLTDIVRFARRFGAGNARLRKRFGVLIPPANRAELVRDVIGGLWLDPRAHMRRRLLRAYSQG